LHEDGKKSLKGEEVWLSQEEGTGNKNGPCSFLYLFPKKSYDNS